MLHRIYMHLLLPAIVNLNEDTRTARLGVNALPF